MMTIIALFMSVLLQLTAAISALWLLKASRVRLAWILISIALFFIAIRQVLDILMLLGLNISEGVHAVSYWLGIATSAILAFSVIQIARIL